MNDDYSHEKAQADDTISQGHLDAGLDLLTLDFKDLTTKGLEVVQAIRDNFLMTDYQVS
jgi:hypothetical protein